jgi:hypothetical protein
MSAPEAKVEAKKEEEKKDEVPTTIKSPEVIDKYQNAADIANSNCRSRGSSTPVVAPLCIASATAAAGGAGCSSSAVRWEQTACIAGATAGFPAGFPGDGATVTDGPGDTR